MFAKQMNWMLALLPHAMRVLMEGSPADLNLDKLVEQVESLEGVEGLHHLHVWELDEQHRALEAHVVIARDRSEELARI